MRAFLDCGCCITDNGREWCPTCADGTAQDTQSAEIERLGKIIDAQDKALQALRAEVERLRTVERHMALARTEAGCPDDETLVEHCRAQRERADNAAHVNAILRASLAEYKSHYDEAESEVDALRKALEKEVVRPHWLTGYVCGLCGAESKNQDLRHKPKCLLAEVSDDDESYTW